MQSKVASFVGGVQLRLKIDEATSKEDDPTPLYLMDELAQMVGSHGDSINTAVDHIVRRLGNKAPSVKQKALRLVAHMCKRGSAEFRRQMAKHSSVIRELTGFRCEPDAFKGDIPWKRVQQYAQEALASLHGAPEPQAGSGSALGARIQGFGGAGGGGRSGGMSGFGSESLGAYSGGGGGGGEGGSYSGSGSRMVGFGSDSMPRGGGGGGRGTGSYGGHGGYGSLAASGGGGGAGGGILGSLSSGVRTLSGSFSGGGGGAVRPADSLLSEEGYGGAANGAGGYSVPAAGAHPAGMAPASGGLAGASGAGTQETRAVGKICTPAGLRAAPDREDLQAFVEQVSSLNGTEVARLLQERLERGPWQATLRALCAIEAVIEGGSSASCGEVAVHFQANPGPVRRASESPQSSVRQRAGKVLRLIGDETLPPSGSSGTGSAAAAAQPLVADLLGEAEAAAAAAPAAAAGGANLLGEPSSASTATSVQASTSSVEDLLVGLEPAPAPAAAAGPAALPADLFGGLSVASGGPSAAGGAAPAPASTGAVGLGDLLGGGLAGGVGASSSQPASLLGGLGATPALPPQAGAASGGDLFSGLSMGAGAHGPAPSLTSLGSGLSSTSSASTAAVPAAPKHGKQPSNSLEDLLTELHITAPAAAQQPMKPTGLGPLGAAPAGAPSGLPHGGGAPGLAGPSAGLSNFALGGHQLLQQPGVGLGMPGLQPPVGAPAGMLPPQQQQALLLMQQQQAALIAQMQQMGLNPMQMQQMLVQQQQQFALMQQQAALGGGVGVGVGGAAPFMMAPAPPQMPPAVNVTGSGRGAIPLEEFHDTFSRKDSTTPTHKKDASFDFIGDQLENMKKK